MGFIRFSYDCFRAKVWNEVSEENGWVFDFDDTDKTFRVWESGESEALGNEPDFVCRNLNEVCDIVQTFK